MTCNVCTINEAIATAWEASATLVGIVPRDKFGEDGYLRSESPAYAILSDVGQQRQVFHSGIELGSMLYKLHVSLCTKQDRVDLIAGLVDLRCATGCCTEEGQVLRIHIGRPRKYYFGADNTFRADINVSVDYALTRSTCDAC